MKKYQPMKKFLLITAMVMLCTYSKAQNPVLYEIKDQSLVQLNPFLFTTSTFYYYDVLKRNIMTVVTNNRNLEIRLNIYEASGTKDFQLLLKKRKGKWFSNKSFDELMATNVFELINKILKM